MTFTIQDIFGVSKNGDILMGPQYLTIPLPSVSSKGSQIENLYQPPPHEVVEGTSPGGFVFKVNVVGDYGSVHEVGQAYDALIASRQAAYAAECDARTARGLPACNCRL